MNIRHLISTHNIVFVMAALPVCVCPAWAGSQAVKPVSSSARQSLLAATRLSAQPSQGPAPETLASQEQNQGQTQLRTPVHFAGLLNDYSLANPLISGSPYEMHGQWSMDLHESSTADFLADMTMSDYGTTNGLLDGTKGGQNAHTHHIRLTNVTILWNMVGCPVYSPPLTITGFQIKGTVSLATGNGSNAPFETTPPSSTLQVCVTGGTEITYSNMTMVFGGPATNHFGTQAIHGVVGKSPTARCDVNGDGQVDNRDIGLIFAARNTPASSPADQRDADGDLQITVADARLCQQRCTQTSCAVQ